MHAFNALRRTATQPGHRTIRHADHPRPTAPQRGSAAGDALAWFDSSWDLRQGLDVMELDAAPSDWPCFAITSVQAAGAMRTG